MIIKVMTLFPEMFSGPLGNSIIQRAQENRILHIQCVNIRDYAENKHKKVDDYPFGGGPGMVMTPQPIVSCYESIVKEFQDKNHVEQPKVIYLSPKGKKFDQEMAERLSEENALILLCGHYEGIDQRVIDEIVTDEISIGDYVLTGGEIPAMVLIDAVARLIPGVLSQDASFEEESFYSGLLEYPQYTRPRVFRGRSVPDVLTSGNHSKIQEWRRNQSLELTFHRRPDLLKDFILTKKDQLFLEQIKSKK